MTSGKGANPDSSDAGFDLESQLDDLLEQIEQAEPGLISTPAPKADQTTASKSDTTATPKASAAPVVDQEDELDFEGAFDTVEATIDADAESSSNLDRQTADVSDLESLDEILSQAADTDVTHAAESTVSDEDDDQNDTDSQTPVSDILATIAALEERQAAAKESEVVDEVETDAEVEVQDAEMFSPDDFITSEQAVDAEMATDTSHQADEHASSDPSDPSDHNNNDNIEADDAQNVQADADDPLGLDLASQIQQLLDDAKADEGLAAKTEPAVVQAADDADDADETDDILNNASFDTVAQVDALAETKSAAVPTSKSKNAIEPFELPENNIPDSDDLQATLNQVAKAVATPEPEGETHLDDVDSKDDITHAADNDTFVEEPVLPQAASESADEPEQAVAQNDDADPVATDDTQGQDADAMSLDDIDQMLADEADEAVAGDFETLSEVLEPAADAAGSKQHEAATASEAQALQSKTDAQAQGDDSEAGGIDDDEMDFAGSFETTQETITQAPDNSNQGLSAGAQAVASELDEQPENKRRDTAGSIGPADNSTAGSSRRSINLAAFARVPDAARQVCETISRPMEAVAPQTRDLVGYIGLITLFWGTVTVILKIIFAMNN